MSSVCVFDAHQMPNLVDHAAYRRCIFQYPGPMHFIQAQTDQRRTLIFRPPYGASNLSYRYGFLRRHGSRLILHREGANAPNFTFAL